MNESSLRIIKVIKGIPYGKVMSYKEVTRRAGIPNGARYVARILHSSSEKHQLPWHRVIRRDGRIALPPERGGALQKSMLQAEGVIFRGDRVVQLREFEPLT